MEENYRREEKNLNLEITQIESEIEGIQVALDYIGSGEAQRQNEALYYRGEITEEEYETDKIKIEKEYETAKEKMKAAEEKLNYLKKQLQIQNELENINKEITKKEEEIESIQVTLDYIGSSEADRENEELYDNGEITKEEYEANKDKINKDYEKAKEKMKLVVEELNKLKEKKDKMLDKKEVNKDVEKDKEKENNEKSNENSDTNVKFNIDKEEEKDVKEQEIVNEPQKEEIKALQKYKKPNRFFSFFKNIVQKIKNIGKSEKSNEVNNLSGGENKVVRKNHIGYEEPDEEFELEVIDLNNKNINSKNSYEDLETSFFEDLDDELDIGFLDLEDDVYSVEEIVENAQNRQNNKKEKEDKNMTREDAQI